jgi:hypothetical protein
MSLVQSQSVGAPYLNGGNVHGGAFVTDKTGGVANAGNTSYGGSGSQATLMQNGKGLYSIQGGATSPSSVQRPSPSISQNGGGRRRRRSKTSRRSRKNRYSRSRSRKYGRKRVTRSHSRSRSRSRRGGYAQYMTNVASAFGQSIPGFPLTSRMSALANPPPFRPYQNCPGGL